MRGSPLNNQRLIIQQTNDFSRKTSDTFHIAKDIALQTYDIYLYTKEPFLKTNEHHITQQMTTAILIYCVYRVMRIKTSSIPPTGTVGNPTGEASAPTGPKHVLARYARCAHNPCFVRRPSRASAAPVRGGQELR